VQHNLNSFCHMHRWSLWSSHFQLILLPCVVKIYINYNYFQHGFPQYLIYWLFNYTYLISFDFKLIFCICLKPFNYFIYKFWKFLLINLYRASSLRHFFLTTWLTWLLLFFFSFFPVFIHFLIHFFCSKISVFCCFFFSFGGSRFNPILSHLSIKQVFSILFIFR
jgi:hypothetical protein